MKAFETVTAIPADEATEAIGKILFQLGGVANEHRGVLGDVASSFIHNYETYEDDAVLARGSIVLLNWVVFPKNQSADQKSVQLGNGESAPKNILGFIKRIMLDKTNYFFGEEEHTAIRYDIARTEIIDKDGNVNPIYSGNDLYVSKQNEIAAKRFASPSKEDFANLKSDGVLTSDTYTQDWSESVAILVAVTIFRRDQIIPVSHISEMYQGLGI